MGEGLLIAETDENGAVAWVWLCAPGSRVDDTSGLVDGGMGEGLLIAETDENGAVAWVWLCAPGSRGPRPAREGLPCEIDPRRARVHGADPQAVMAWLQAQGCLARPDAGGQPIPGRTARPTR